MGIVKISDELHEEVRIAGRAMTRSINAQAEHWMKVGMLAEQNPGMSYIDILKHLTEEARKADREETVIHQHMEKQAV
ncbi:methionine aminopeptidase [Hahella sp. CCB-MM4]|uniref:ParD-like family protein n=1 Tax=Hahella sp. (strain CCB-MM4) TaxID=1926491 RepID=UPI000B9C3425|nr:ParD-like family protein [Hahella sp. CCB-MM4]OZG72185.1 methionine aminopeptidase [Hahella sp. CCB-MM4]